MSKTRSFAVPTPFRETSLYDSIRGACHPPPHRGFLAAPSALRCPLRFSHTIMWQSSIKAVLQPTMTARTRRSIPLTPSTLQCLLPMACPTRLTATHRTTWPKQPKTSLASCPPTICRSPALGRLRVLIRTGAGRQLPRWIRAGEWRLVHTAVPCVAS